MKHDAVRALEVNEKEFIMTISTDNQRIYDGLTILAGKMKKTLDYCRSAVNDITPYTITQDDVVIKRL